MLSNFPCKMAGLQLGFVVQYTPALRSQLVLLADVCHAGQRHRGEFYGARVVLTFVLRCVQQALACPSLP